jgi:hypothetical protein
LLVYCSEHWRGLGGGARDPWPPQSQ